MKRSTIFKVFAITNFVVLFAIFLLYSNGSFNNYFYKNTYDNFTSANGGVGVKQTVDSVKAANDSLQRLQNLRAASSKSLVIRDYIYDAPLKTLPKKDSTPVNPTSKEKKMMERSKPEILYGSKSGMIVQPKIFILDSLFKEKTKKQQ